MSKIIFMGTPDFAEKSLRNLHESKDNEVIAVVTNTDKPKGRGMKLFQSPVKQYALEHNLKIYQPDKIKTNNEFIETLKEMKPDFICVVAYGKILPKEILDIPKYGCINVHASLLPKYRGAAPIQWAIINGEEVTGVTTMYMDTKMDTGDIILEKKVKIGENETTGELWNRLGDLGAELLLETIEKIKDGSAPREKQGENYSMAPMLNREMSKIDWNKLKAKDIKNLVRGLNPIMGAYSILNDKKIKFWKVDIIDEKEFLEKYEIKCDIENLKPGYILYANSKDGLYIKTNDGILSVLEIQGENSKKMNIFDFLRGNRLEKGEIFV